MTFVYNFDIKNLLERCGLVSCVSLGKVGSVWFDVGPPGPFCLGASIVPWNTPGYSSVLSMFIHSAELATWLFLFPPQSVLSCQHRTLSPLSAVNIHVWNDTRLIICLSLPTWCVAEISPQVFTVIHQPHLHVLGLMEGTAAIRGNHKRKGNTDDI